MAADSDQQHFSAGDEFSDYSIYFLLHGGSSNTGLTKGVAKTIHVGTGELSGSAYNDGGSGYPYQVTSEPLPHTLSLTGTVGTVTQTLPQTDDLTTDQTDSGGFHSTQSVDIHAGPTVTFDMGTQGRVDVTPQEYTYSVNSTDSGDVTNPPAPKFAYTLLLRSPAVPPSGISVSPSSVTYPASATGTVTLAKAAPDAETLVLTSSNPAVGVPATVTVAAGQQAVSFPITTGRVDKDTSVILSAAAGTDHEKRHAYGQNAPGNSVHVQHCRSAGN